MTIIIIVGVVCFIVGGNIGFLLAAALIDLPSLRRASYRFVVSDPQSNPTTYLDSQRSWRRQGRF